MPADNASRAPADTAAGPVPADVTSGRAVRVSVSPAVCVRIDVPRTDEERDSLTLVPDTSGMITRFLQWQVAHEVFPDRGGSVGPGSLVQWFPARHADELAAFFAGENLSVTSDG